MAPFRQLFTFIFLNGDFDIAEDFFADAADGTTQSINGLGCVEVEHRHEVLRAEDYDENLEDMELILCAENSSEEDLSLYDDRILVNGEISGVSLWARVAALRNATPLS